MVFSYTFYKGDVIEVLKNDGDSLWQKEKGIDFSFINEYLEAL